MKIQKKITAVPFILVSMMGSQAYAGVSKMVGTWNGTGALFSLQGELEGEYQVSLVDTLNPDGSVASSVTVTIPGIPAKRFQQTLNDTQKGFSITSEQGSGGAICVGEGLCEGYLGDESGNGMAMTTISDGPDTFRVLKTELQNFRAIRLFREKYVRTQSH